MRQYCTLVEISGCEKGQIQMFGLFLASFFQIPHCCIYGLIHIMLIINGENVSVASKTQPYRC